eukprot:357320-Chlamydomonas_euryale.AAC.3
MLLTTCRLRGQPPAFVPALVPPHRQAPNHLPVTRTAPPFMPALVPPLCAGIGAPHRQARPTCLLPCFPVSSMALQLIHGRRTLGRGRQRAARCATHVALCCTMQSCSLPQQGAAVQQLARQEDTRLDPHTLG